MQSRNFGGSIDLGGNALTQDVNAHANGNSASMRLSMMANTKFVVPNPGSGILSQGGGGHLRNNKSISIGNPGGNASTNIEHSSLASTHRKKSS